MKLFRLLKKNRLLLLLPLGLALLVGCEEQRILFEGDRSVRFTDSTAVYKESYGLPVDVSVHLVGKPVTTAVTVSYIIEGTAREGRDFVIEGTRGTVTIPANQYFGKIPVRIINNANNILESQEIIFTITGVTPSEEIKVGFGRNNSVGRSFRLTIQDDCLLGGTYSGTRRGFNEVIQNIEITSLNCVDYRLSNWNVGVFNLNAIKAPLTFRDNGDNTLTIPTQVSPDLTAPYDTLRGSGVWNPQTRAITLNLQLKFRATATRDTVITVPFTFRPRS